MSRPVHLLVPVLGLALAACTPDFESASLVKDLRILAIRADPPEATVDLAASTVETVRVTVLFADPAAPAGAQAALSAEGCFPSDTGRCEPPSLPLASGSGPIGERAFDVAVPGALLAGALQDDRLKGLGGIRLQVSITLDTADPYGPQTGRKLLLYSPKDPARPPNRAPKLLGLRVLRDGAVIGEWHPGDSLSFVRGRAIGLRPLLEEGSIEEYDATDLAGKVVHLREAVAHAFFVTDPGDLDRGGAEEPLPGVSDPPAGFVRLDARRVGSGTLWVVTRDRRGGIDWLSVPWRANEN